MMCSFAGIQKGGPIVGAAFQGTLLPDGPDVYCGGVAREHPRLNAAIFVQAPGQRQVVADHGDHMRAGHNVREFKTPMSVGLDGKPVVKKYREIGGSFARYAFSTLALALIFLHLSHFAGI